jgi:hypothetical protein
MNSELEAALREARRQQDDLERQLGPVRPLAPYRVEPSSEEQQAAALAEMEALETLRYRFKPQADITLAELAAVLIFTGEFQKNISFQPQ